MQYDYIQYLFCHYIANGQTHYTCERLKRWYKKLDQNENQCWGRSISGHMQGRGCLNISSFNIQRLYLVRWSYLSPLKHKACRPDLNREPQLRCWVKASLPSLSLPERVLPNRLSTVITVIHTTVQHLNLYLCSILAHLYQLCSPERVYLWPRLTIHLWACIGIIDAFRQN